MTEFYGLVTKRNLVCFREWGLVGGLLLMIGTFLHCTGMLGIHDSPARVNDFEASFLKEISDAAIDTMISYCVHRAV